MVKGGYVPGRTHPTDRARGQTTAMPTAVAAARQSYADHPMVRLETAPPGPCHAVSLQETLSGTFTACATVILGQNLHLLAVSPTAPETLCSTESRFQPNPNSRRISDRNSHPTPNRQPILPAMRESQAAARTRRCAKRPLIPSSSRDVAIWNHRKRPFGSTIATPFSRRQRSRPFERHCAA